MAEVIAAFGAADGWHERADPLAQTTNGPLRELLKKGFDFAERHLNRVKVRRVLRQIPHHCTGCFDRVLHARNLVGRKVIHHHVVAFEREDFPVHWPINHHWRRHLIMTQGGYERGRLPLSLRNVTDQARAARAASPETDHIGACRSLIKEYQSGRIEKPLLSYPAPPRASHIRAMLLRRPQSFF
jgi:hypothetical protein